MSQQPKKGIYDMATLQELKANILASDGIDSDKVKQIRVAIYEDDVSPGAIDRDEANVLFEMNDHVSGKVNDATWGNLFAEAIGDHVLKDDESPGAIDDDEAKWLIESLFADDKIDDVEVLLLKRIRTEATSIPEKLDAEMKKVSI